MNHTPRNNPVFIILFCLLIVALLAIGFLTFKIGGEVTALTTRVNDLERQPATVVREVTPEAGASAQPTTIAAPQIAKNPIETLAPIKTSTPSATATPAAKVRQTTFIPIVASHSTTQNEWVDVKASDFSVNLSVEYGTAAYVTWDANLMVESGSGETAARIFDVTHSVAVPGSEVTSSAPQVETRTSGRVTLLSGQNTYRVQIKSKTSTIASFLGGRVKIVY